MIRLAYFLTSVPIPVPIPGSCPFFPRHRTCGRLGSHCGSLDPLKCPSCGGTMEVVAFVENSSRPEVVQEILHHCGLWKDSPQRARPECLPGAECLPRQLAHDYSLVTAGILPRSDAGSPMCGSRTRWVQPSCVPCIVSRSTAPETVIPLPAPRPSHAPKRAERLTPGPQ
jgi:hypothetical protein